MLLYVFCYNNKMNIFAAKPYYKIKKKKIKLSPDNVGLYFV